MINVPKEAEVQGREKFHLKLWRKKYSIIGDKKTKISLLLSLSLPPTFPWSAYSKVLMLVKFWKETLQKEKIQGTDDMVHQRALKEKEDWNYSLEQSQILLMEYITLELGSLILFSLCSSPLSWLLLQSPEAAFSSVSP